MGARPAVTTASNGDAWSHFPYDQARPAPTGGAWDYSLVRATIEESTWGSCIAMWNGRDPILKERLFTLNAEATIKETSRSSTGHSMAR